MTCNRKGANQGKEKLDRISIRNSLILDSSMVEHSAVNRVVVGSSPTRGAQKISGRLVLVIIQIKLNVCASL